MSFAATCILCRQMSDAAAGPGIPGRQRGCTVSRWKAFSVFTVQGDKLRIDPCIPKAWPGFQIAYRHRSCHYDIAIENPNNVGKGVGLIEIDGIELPSQDGGLIPLADDGAVHKVRVVLG